MTPNLTNLLNNNTRLFFISPHLDDAILSAGGLIYDLKDNNKIKIITVFTKGDKFFVDRKMEDKKVCQYLGVNYLHLGFKDALWRKTYNSIKNIFSKKINSTKEEAELEKIIIKKLKKIIKNTKNTIIFAPLSIGNHIDHRIINKICRENFTNVIYWEDYPYNLKLNLSEELVKKNSLTKFEFSKNLLVKDKLIKFYKSQITSLFGDKPIILKKEKYYFSESN